MTPPKFPLVEALGVRVEHATQALISKEWWICAADLERILAAAPVVYSAQGGPQE